MKLTRNKVARQRGRWFVVRVRRIVGGSILLVAILGASISSRGASLAGGAELRSSTGSPPRIEPSLRAMIAKQGVGDTLVLLRERAELSAAERSETRAERIGFVYDRLREVADRSQARAIGELKTLGVEYHAFHVVNAIWIPRATPAVLDRLSRLHEIAGFRLNPTIRAEADLSGPRRRDGASPTQPKVPENLRVIGADRVWSAFATRGEGILVGIQDSGFQWTHRAIRDRYRGNLGLNVNHDYSWLDANPAEPPSPRPAPCRAPAPEPCYESSHGTHVTGLVVGTEPTGNPIGVAPGAQWIACRNMKNGVGSAATYLRCFEFFLAPYPRGGNPRTEGRPELAPHVVNNSWRCDSQEGCKGDEFIDAVRALRAAGIFVVASAGNNGSSCGTVDGAPGFYSGEILATAAFDARTGRIGDFSSRGPSTWNGGVGVSLAAPGVEVRSSIPSSDGNAYESKSGTSMASPHVAGAVALLWSARPELIGKVAETTERLQRTADPVTTSQSCGKFPGSAIPNAVFGYGKLNVYRAVTE